MKLLLFFDFFFFNLFVVHQRLYKIFIAFCELFHGSLILFIVNVLKRHKL